MERLNEREIALIKMAKEKHSDLTMIEGRELKNCFTEWKGRLLFWFDRPSGDKKTTGIIVENR